MGRRSSSNMAGLQPRAAYTIPSALCPTSSTASFTPTGVPLVSPAPLSTTLEHQQGQTCHAALEDTPFLDVPPHSLSDDHSDPYMTSGCDSDSEDLDEDAQLSNGEVRFLLVLSRGQCLTHRRLQTTYLV
jgi:hypothetical protein